MAPFHWLSLLFVLLLLATPCPSLAAQPPLEELAVLEAPAPESVVIDKKPEIRVRFLAPYSKDYLLVLLDGSDVTQIVKWGDEGFELTPVDPLAGGPHTLSIAGYLPDGTPLESQFSFTSRQGTFFDDLSTQNTLTLNHSTALYRDGPAREPWWRFDGNLTSESQLRRDPWEIELKATGRYVSKEGKIESPEREQIDLTEVLLRTAFKRGNLEAAAEIGDTQVDESLLTVNSLSRRGGKVSATLGPVTIGGFAVRSKEEYGLDDPEEETLSERLGITTELGETEETDIDTSGDADEEIMGASAELALFDKKVRFKGIYAEGGENGSSFGLSTTQAPADGSVGAVLFSTDLFERRFATELEAARSDYDSDGKGKTPSVRDDAWRLKLKGEWGKTFYEAGYDYVGPKYQVVANPMIVNDQRGPTLGGGATLGDHTLSASLSQTEDNLDGEDLYPVTESRGAQANYTYNGFESLPLSLGYSLATTRSSDEPDPLTKTRQRTDMLLATASRSWEVLTLSTQGSVSWQDDQTSADADTTAWSASLMTSLNLGAFFATSGYSFNRIEDHSGGGNSDTHTILLDLQGDLFDGLLKANCSTTLDFTRSDQAEMKRDSLAADMQLAYRLKFPTLDWLEPLVGVRLIWNAADGPGAQGEEDEMAVMLTFSTTALFQR